MIHRFCSAVFLSPVRKKKKNSDIASCLLMQQSPQALMKDSCIGKRREPVEVYLGRLRWRYIWAVSRCSQKSALALDNILRLTKPGD